MPQPIGTIDLITVGKLRGKAWQFAQADYVKRLSYYTRLNLVEVKDFVGQSLPEAVAKQKEGELLLKAAGVVNQIILLTPEGRQLSSPELAEFVGQGVEVNGRLAFLIGGPFGFADEVVRAAGQQLSLSRLTFPHELARVIFLEQLYRAFTILRGESYHK